MSKIRIGIVGLGFGAEFIPIYQAHPDVELVALCQRNESKLTAIADSFGVSRRYTDFGDMLDDKDIDAVHINTPIPEHAEQTIAALNAGKHVACTVPMATSLWDCQRIIEAQQKSGKTYMMMETAVYTREFLFARELTESADFGPIQFLRGAHQQEMAGWPGYWEGLPPMYYATHAVAPLLALAHGEAESVHCLGSGTIAPDLASNYGSPFAVESALFTLKDSPLAMEVTRSLFETAREYVESFDVYGSRMSFEWQQLESELPVVFKGEAGTRVDVPDYAHLLPEEIRAFTTAGVFDEEENQHLSFVQGSGHGGSHPHLANEFVSSIAAGRPPFPDVYTSANWTAAGLCAHESAMAGGAVVALPDFRSPS